MAWQKQEVRDSRSGITDIVKNSPPSFQEECINLIHDNKEGNLEQRAGSEYWTTFDAPSTIRQIFQLEDYVFAYCYDDPVTPGDDIDGRVYWVLEDGSSVSWTEVETEGEDTSFLIRLRDSKNKGLDISIPEGDPSLVDVFKTKLTTSIQVTPSVGILGGRLNLTVEEDNLDAAGYYIRQDTFQEYDYEDLKTAIESVSINYTVTYSPLTVASDFVHFSGSFEPDALDDGPQTGVGATTGRWTSGFLPAFEKEGHIKITPWSGHLFLELEPYDKSFTPNDDDPYAKNPDSFPPGNDRQPLRKLYLQNHDNVITPVLQNAQNSKMFLGYDYSETTNLSDTDTSYRYAKQTYDLRRNTTPGSETIGYIDLYYERGFAPGPVLPEIGLRLGSAITARIDDNIDWTTFQPAWGAYVAYLSTTSAGGGTAQEFSDELTSLLNQKATNNTYGSPFRFITVIRGCEPDDFAGALMQGPGSGGTNQPTLIKALPPEISGNTSYVYGCYMRNTYEAQDEGAPKTFVNDGQVTLMTYPALSAINDETIEFDQIDVGTDLFITDKYPTLWIGRHKNYLYDSTLHIQDTDEIKLTRTEANGTTSYITKTILEMEPIASNYPPDEIRYNSDDWETNVGETADVTDTLRDSLLREEETAYFNGNVESHDSLPQQGSYYFTVVNQTGYHANIMGNVQRVYESPPGVPYAAPSLFFEDFDDVVTGISHFSNKPIIFTPNTTWRWEGTNGLDGSGRTFTRLVSDEFGCIANQSIVRTNVGLFFWSKTGIIFTDGLRALRVTEHLVDRYSDWLSYLQTSSEEIGPRYLRGFYDEIRRRVLWSALDEDSNPIIVVLDVFDGLSDKMPIFIEKGNSNTRWTGTEYETINMYQTSGAYFSEDNNSIYRAQDRRILKVTDNSTNDEYWTGTETLSIPIKTYFKSVAFDYGIRSNKKWTQNIMWGFEDLARTGVSLQPLGWNDLSALPHNLYPMVNYQHIEWSADYANTPQTSLEQFFGHTDVSFKSEFIVSYKRKFPRGKIRNTFKQVGFEHLPINLGDLNEGSGNVTNIDVNYVAGTGKNLVEIEVSVSDTGDNALVDLGLDASGSFYVKWDNQDTWLKVHDFDLAGSIYILQVYVSDETNVNHTYTDAWPVMVGKVFSDQRILLSDYTMTFRDMGDRTKGVVKSSDEGGFNG